MILSMLMPYKWAAIGLAVVGACAWSGWQGYTSGRDRVQAKWDAAVVQQNLAARATEQANAFKAGVIDHDLTQARIAADRASSLAGQRLRDLAAVRSASSDALASCRNDGAPAIATVHRDVGDDLVALAASADATASKLRACQRWVRDVQP